MKRISYVAGLLLSCVFFQSVAAEKLEDWKDPNVIEHNRLPMSSTFTTDQQKTLSLNGVWKFKFNESIAARTKGFEASAYDDSSWGTIPVPGNWELNGYCDPVYLNIGYAWRGSYKNNPPVPPIERNYVGQYRKSFDIAQDWIGKDICLCIGSATSNVRVWVNGKEVGYSEDSKLEARFNITKFVKAGKNTIALEIFRWCDGSYLEDQDFWRLSGIARGVYVYTREQKKLEDIKISASADGSISLVTEVTPGVAFVSYEVLDAKGDKVASFNEPVVKKYEVSALGNVLLRSSAKVENPLLWSAETPNLYTLTVKASDRKGLCESTSLKFGFRTVEIRNAQLLVNGRPVLIKGANRHEMNPYKGYVVSEEDMIEDIRIFKELNINTVRTCHYPNDPLWYSLCDKYGIYVIDEGNIESHGMGYGNETLAKDPQYEYAHLQRDERMVRRDYNHPSVIVWSLGNEAGNGENFYKCYDWIKAFDKTRPVMYERAEQDRNTDIFCPMYASPSRCVKYCVNNPSRPLIQCEYAHAMGNSLGGFKEYWDLIRKYPAYQGGCIWDFADQALYWKSDASKTGSDHIFVFGGDFNDYDPSDGSFNCNGIIAADRSYHPHAYEVRYQYRSILTSLSSPSWFTARDVSDCSVDVYNENFFIDLSRYSMSWNVEVNGVKVLSGCIDDLKVAPQDTETVSLGFSRQYLLDAAFKVTGSEDFRYSDVNLNVSYALKTNDGLLDAGTEVAYDQIPLYEGGLKVEPRFAAAFSGEKEADAAVSSRSKLPVRSNVPALSKLPARSKNGNSVVFSGMYSFAGDGLERGGEWTATFDETAGTLVSYTMGGKELLAGALTPSFGRAPTENDMGAKLQDKRKVWMYPSFDVYSCKVTEGADCYVVTTVFKAIQSASVRMTYYVYADGSIAACEAMKDAGGLDKMPDLFRFGMKLPMSGSYSVIDFFGKGPWENYSDRNSSALEGHYAQSINDQYHYGYVRAQESGTKTGLRYLKVLNDNGAGLEFTSDVKFSASVLPFSQQDMDATLNGTPSRPNPTNKQVGAPLHSLELKAKARDNDRSAGTTYVNFDLVQTGLGCINSWGALPLEEYIIHPCEREFHFVIRPVDN
ncbi:MAG: glycoside hydrolase family 2 TIM barrel-domain containing protein [Bacteroidales bacterium]